MNADIVKNLLPILENFGFSKDVISEKTLPFITDGINAMEKKYNEKIFFVAGTNEKNELYLMIYSANNSTVLDSINPAELVNNILKLIE
jgi:hypothetical protein